MAGNTVHNQVSDNVNHPLDLKAPNDDRLYLLGAESCDVGSISA